VSALGDLFAEQLDARRPRVAHPKGFEPGVRFSVDSGLPESAVIASDVELAAGDHRAKIEEQTRLTIPADLDVRLERLTLQNDGSGRVERWWYKYVFVPRTTSALREAVDPVALLKQLRGNRKAPTPIYDGGATLGLSWNDTQGGKKTGGGTPALFERFDGQIEAAKHRAKELRRIGRDFGRLVIIGGGDIIEGCTIYQNQPHEIDMDRRGQVKAMTALILDGLDRLAPLFEQVTVLAVGGNHGENRINGNRTTRHDNDDCLVFENAAVAAAERDPRLQHVNFVIAQDEPAKTLDVHGWVLATTHGQAFGKGAGTPEVKAHNWYKGQAAGHQPAGDAHLLISHHYHHYSVRDWGACQWVQTPANDGGSPQHTDLTGEHAASGMLSWVMTPQRRYVDEHIL
jgi:hypothetical protein